MAKGPSFDPKRSLTLGVSIQLPTRPKFLRFGTEANADGAISIGSLTNKELRAVGRAWTEALIEDAAAVRASKKDPFGVIRRSPEPEATP